MVGTCTDPTKVCVPESAALPPNTTLAVLPLRVSGMPEEMHYLGISLADVGYMAGIAALVRERLEAVRLDRAALERIVLTGGGAQLEGIDGYWAELRGATVRVGKPAAIEGASPDMLGPAFATVGGLVGDVLQQHFAARAGGNRGWRGNGYVSWIGNWLSRAKA